MANILWTACALFGLLSLSEGAKILVVFPLPARSHNILGEGFVRVLTKAGHEVTYLTPFPKNDSTPNLRYLSVKKNFEAFPPDPINLKEAFEKGQVTLDMSNFFKILSGLARVTFEQEEMQKIVNDPNEKFDLIIVEWMFSEFFSGLAAVFDCPFIWFSSVEPHSLALQLIDEATNPAYEAGVMTNNYPPFSFFQRVQELFLQVSTDLLRSLYLIPSESKDFENIYGPILAKKGRPLPTYDEVRYNASLMLGNSDVSIGKATRLPQNYKPIGGYHINRDVKPLPQDLQKLMDNAKNGVIYFSMGSNAKSKDFPDVIKQDLLKMFGGLKYTVIWKFEEQLSGVPKNVHIVQWAPQTSILSHPNLKLFITHGGRLSTLEAIHFGVPTIGIPVFADQFMNVDTAVHKGYALRVDLSYKMPDELKAAIEEILSNPKYKQRTAELNLIFHDRPVTPEAELVHWVNHVVRTKGAPHLRSVALMVPWYQKVYLDLMLLVAGVLYIILKVLKMLCCSRKKTTSAKKKN